MNIARAFDAFIYDSLNPGPMYIFGNLADPKSIVKIAIYTLEVTIADSILVGRALLLLNVLITSDMKIYRTYII